MHLDSLALAFEQDLLKWHVPVSLMNAWALKHHLELTNRKLLKCCFVNTRLSTVIAFTAQVRVALKTVVLYNVSIVS